MSTQNTPAVVISEDQTMVEVNVDALIGKALDYAVGVAAGWGIRVLDLSFAVEVTWQHSSPVPRTTFCRPTEDWNLLGLLILTNAIVLGNHESGKEDGKFWGSAHCYYGDTEFQTHDGIMVAACRAIVALKFGQTVSIPRVLLRETNV